jgi:hypothetical protein
MRSNKERLIERYISGRMGQAEQREFLARAEHDPALRRMLKAEQVIGSAIAHDRAAIPLVGMEPGAKVLAKLAATNPAGVGAATGTAATAGAGSAVAGSSLLGTMFAKIVLGVVGIVGVAVGTFMIAPALRTTPEATPAARGNSAAHAPRLDAPKAPAPASTSPAGDRTSSSATDGRAIDAAHTVQSSTASPRSGSERSLGAMGMGEISSVASRHQSVGSTKNAVAPAHDPPPLEVENNHVRVDIKMNRDKDK